MSDAPLGGLFPVDPLDGLGAENVQDYRRRLICGILESYNSNYDFMVEALQNAVDALEDAELLELPGSRLLRMRVDLQNNAFSVLDTGVGMTREEVISAYKPHFSGKTGQALLSERRERGAYRGYKGVGLTFLAYATDYIRLHAKKDGVITATRMQYGRAWAMGERPDPAVVDEDPDPSPLEEHERGTFVEVRFSASTRPRSLAHLGNPEAWEAVLRTRTALGQILMDQEPIATIEAVLEVVASD